MRLRVYEGFVIVPKHNLDLDMNGLVLWVKSSLLHEKEFKQNYWLVTFFVTGHVSKYKNYSYCIKPGNMNY